MCEGSLGHKVRRWRQNFCLPLFTVARKMAPGQGTTGNEGGGEKPAWAWPGSTQNKQTCLSQFKTASQGPDQAREEACPSRPLGAPVSMLVTAVAPSRCRALL